MTSREFIMTAQEYWWCHKNVWRHMNVKKLKTVEEDKSQCSGISHFQTYQLVHWWCQENVFWYHTNTLWYHKNVWRHMNVEKLKTIFRDESQCSGISHFKTYQLLHWWRHENVWCHTIVKILKSFSETRVNV